MKKRQNKAKKSNKNKSIRNTPSVEEKQKYEEELNEVESLIQSIDNDNKVDNDDLDVELGEEIGVTEVELSDTLSGSNESEKVEIEESEVEETEIEEVDVKEAEAELVESEEAETEEAETEEAETEESETEEVETEEAETEEAETEEVETEEVESEEVESEEAESEEAESEESEIDAEVANDLGILTKEEKKARRKKRFKRFLHAMLVLLILTGALYGAGAYYFDTHFYFDTTVNGVDVSFKSQNDVQELMKNEIDKYEILIVEDEEELDSITANEVELAYIKSNEISKFIKKQNIWEWPLMFIEKSKFEFKFEVELNEDLLTEVLSALEFLDISEEEVIKAANAYPSFEDGEVKIVEEICGNTVSESFEENIKGSILLLDEQFDMKEGGYTQPKYVSDAEEVIAAKELMEKYLTNTITYSEGDVIDEAQIAKWLKVDKGELGISLDEDAIKEYVKSLASKYNTVGTSRTFNNPDGRQVSVSGGSYGWTVNQSAEVDKIISNIKGNEAVERSMEYSKKANSHGEADWGNTFAMIDLTNQKMWMVVDGKVVVSSSVVTGKVSSGDATPQGVYSVSYTTANAVLRGAVQPDGTREYETPVAYWMPFNGGIGFHDATWRSSFGGTIYKNSGSHGCINMPLSKAKELYKYLKAGMPVICHY